MNMPYHGQLVIMLAMLLFAMALIPMAVISALKLNVS